MNITIHQPEHLPWLGLFHKIALSDVFVVLDNVQYRRRYFQNRNKIRTNKGWQWVIVPLVKDDRDELLIKDAKIFNKDIRWKKSNLDSIRQNYSRTPFFKLYWDCFSAVYGKTHVWLVDLNMDLLRFVFEQLGLKPEIKFASELNVSGEKSDLIFNICSAMKARTYVSGISGREYLDLQKFKVNGIKVVIQEFHHPIYAQLYKPFLPCMSVIDLLFNHGPKSLDIINGIGVSVMEDLFL
jgi:hypothetical protein